MGFPTLGKYIQKIEGRSRTIPLIVMRINRPPHGSLLTH